MINLIKIVIIIIKKIIIIKAQKATTTTNNRKKAKAWNVTQPDYSLRAGKGPQWKRLLNVILLGGGSLVVPYYATYWVVSSSS